jgi:hypothetical protein
MQPMTGQYDEKRLFVSRLFRYSLAVVGPVGSALAQFALSVVLLKALASSAFGAFSFLLIASQLSSGVVGALFCAPLPILMTLRDADERKSVVGTLFATNLLAAILAVLVFTGLGLALGVGAFAALLFAGFAAVSSLRWFARAYAYATGAPMKSTSSDLFYSATLALGVLGTSALGAHVLESAFGALFLSAVAGLLPFGASYAAAQFVRVRMRDVVRYRDVWKNHSGWSLLGVLTTEATGNAHAYAVTFAFGASAFAPLAASALLIRPIGVVTNALTEFERAQMARQIGEGGIGAAMASRHFFRLALGATWVGTAVAAAVLFVHAPRLLFPAHYDTAVLATGAALWIAVAGVRVARTPDSVLMQAAGEFRLLAFASVISSVGSIAAVCGLMAANGPLWSIAGVLIGELLFNIWIWRQVGRWNLQRAVS